MGVGAIPYTAMLTWVDRWCKYDETKELFLEVLPQMDNVYLEYIKEQQDKESG